MASRKEVNIVRANEGGFIVSFAGEDTQQTQQVDLNLAGDFDSLVKVLNKILVPVQTHEAPAGVQ